MAVRQHLAPACRATSGTRIMLVLAALIANACASGTAPTPTPGGMDEAIANLVLRGVTIHSLVSGDPGCPTSDLHDNAVRLEVSFAAQSSIKDIYLFQWRRASDYDAASEAFNDCVAEYGELRPGVDITPVQATPWRAYGPGWGDDSKIVVEHALREAAGF